jgi:hypothetical protein
MPGRYPARHGFAGRGGDARPAHRFSRRHQSRRRHRRWRRHLRLDAFRAPTRALGSNMPGSTHASIVRPASRASTSPRAWRISPSQVASAFRRRCATMSWTGSASVSTIWASSRSRTSPARSASIACSSATAKRGMRWPRRPRRHHKISASPRRNPPVKPGAGADACQPNINAPLRRTPESIPPMRSPQP